MLRAEGFAGVGRGLFRFEAAQCVIYDRHRNPVVVAFEHGGAVKVSVQGDEDFDDYCRLLGYAVQTHPVVPE